MTETTSAGFSDPCYTRLAKQNKIIFPARGGPRPGYRDLERVVHNYKIYVKLITIFYISFSYFIQNYVSD
jgi:hypothetical protein